MSTLAPSTISALFIRLRREDFAFWGKPSCVFADMNLLLANRGFFDPGTSGAQIRDI
jgi:hypothetical protein